MRCKEMTGWGGRGGSLAVLAALGLVALAAAPAQAIDVKLTMDDAKKALAAGREPMEKADTPEDVKKVMQHASLATRIGSDPEKDPCGASAILRTKRFWLESFGRKEAAETKKQKKDVRMPEDKIQKYLDMPNLEVEVQLCGDDEYFAEGAQVAFQQGSKTVKPIDVSPADKGRKNEGQGPAYRSRFTARFAYDSFDPNAKTKVQIYFPDGKMSEFESDFSKVK
ncbi:MAG: hypothetical protein EPO61_09685 [Nitrospirae bacterium]|nr:MAG: hypothetical protein EPO61_09685 [Nitrospirota bacterium]